MDVYNLSICILLAHLLSAEGQAGIREGGRLKMAIKKGYHKKCVQLQHDNRTGARELSRSPSVNSQPLYEGVFVQNQCTKNYSQHTKIN